MTVRRNATEDDGSRGHAAEAEVVRWDEFGQGYNADAECVVCICGALYPHRWDHYCPADDCGEREEDY